MGLLALQPWEFSQYTVREFEEAVVGAYVRHTHTIDLLMRHALVTGQWSKPVSFRDLTGREAPLPLDPRHTPDEPEDDLASIEQWMRVTEMKIRSQSGITILE